MKKLFIFLLIGMFLISFVSATTWTRSVEYNIEDVREVTFKNWWGLGGNQGSMKLTSHNLDEKGEIITLQVGTGNQVTMYYDFEFNELIKDGLGNVDFIDMKTGKNIDREYNYVYWDEIEKEKEVCIKYSKILNANGTMEDKCSEYKIEKYTEGKWTNYNSKDIITEKIRIGILVNTLDGDYIDGIWNIGNKKIDRHAVWNSSLSNHLIAYYKLDEISGPVIDSIKGLHNGTNNGGTTNVDGIINKSYYFTGNQNVSLPTGYGVFDNNEWTINLWTKMTNFGSNALMLKLDGEARIQLNEGAGKPRFEVNGGGSIIAPYIPQLEQWVMITLRQNSTGRTMFYNGTMVGTNSETAVAEDGTGIPAFGSLTAGFNGTYDEIGFWNRSLSDSEITTLYAGGDGMSYTTGYFYFIYNSSQYFIECSEEEVFNLTYPILSDYGVFGGESNINYTCDGVPYSTSVTLTNQKNISLYYLNGTFLNNYSWDYKIFENSRTYNATVYETAYEGYNINLTSNSSLTAVNLLFNSTSYSMSNQGSGIWSYSRDLPISVVGNNSIQFRFTYNGDIINSDTTYQNVSSIFFGLCNATYTNHFLNLTFKDESDLSSLNGTIPTSTFTYYLGNGAETKEYTLVNNTENLNYGFCASPDLTFYVDPYIQYASSGYPQRIWNPTLINYTSTITSQILYLLSSTDGLYVTFQVVNVADQTISGVEVIATRDIGGVDVVVGQGTTGDDGSVTLWLNPDFIHSFSFSKTGFTTFETSFAPTQSSYTITMGEGVEVPSSYFKGIDYFITPTNSSLVNDTTYSFGFRLTSSFWDLDEYGFNLRLNNGTIITGDTTSTSGTQLSINYNTGSNITRIYLDYYWLINGTYTNGTREWKVYSTDNTQWSIGTFFSDLKSYMAVGIFGLDEFGRYFIIFFGLFLTIGVMSYKYGLTSPMTVFTMIFLTIFFFDVVVDLIPDISLAGGVVVPNILTFITGLILILIIFREVNSQ